MTRAMPTMYCTVCTLLFVAAVLRSRFGDMRTQFRKSQIQLKKWHELPPSGSGRKTSKQPKPYKYAAELAFLVEVLKLEATEETYTPRYKQRRFRLGKQCTFIASVFSSDMTKLLGLLIHADYINRRCQSTEPSLLKYSANCSRNCIASIATRPLCRLQLHKTSCRRFICQPPSWNLLLSTSTLSSVLCVTVCHHTRSYADNGC